MLYESRGRFGLSKTFKRKGVMRRALNGHETESQRGLVNCSSMEGTLLADPVTKNKTFFQKSFSKFLQGLKVARETTSLNICLLKHYNVFHFPF